MLHAYDAHHIANDAIVSEDILKRIETAVITVAQLGQYEVTVDISDLKDRQLNNLLRILQDTQYSVYVKLKRVEQSDDQIIELTLSWKNVVK